MTKQARNLIKKIQKLEGVKELQRVSIDYGTNELVFKVKVSDENCTKEEEEVQEEKWILGRLIDVDGVKTGETFYGENTFEIVLYIGNPENFLEVAEKTTNMVYEEYGDRVFEREFKEKNAIIFRVNK